MTPSPTRRAWQRWRFAAALNVAVIPWVASAAPHNDVPPGLLVSIHRPTPTSSTTSTSLAPATKGTTVDVSTSTVTPTTTVPARTSVPHVAPVPASHRSAVGVTRCTFIDPSRSVYDYSTVPARIRSTQRTLLTEIRYPIAAAHGGALETAGATPLAHVGGYPLIVFAHGYDVSPDTYATLLDDWARSGFVVVSPFFPDEKHSAVTAQHGADTEGDLANEPADLSFVTRSVLNASSQRDPACLLVQGLVNPSHLAMAGQSDGANAVATLLYNQGLDPQGVPFARLDEGLNVQAVMILSGQEAPAQTYRSPSNAPALLMVQSLQDQCNSPRSALTLYHDLHQSNKWFLELQSAHHLPPYNGVDKPAFRVVVATTIHFLAAQLQGARLATSLTDFANRSPTIARMFSGPPGPTVTNLPVFTGVCGLT